MSDIAIKVENLGKRYRISHQQQGVKRYKALRDVLAEKFKSPFKKFTSRYISPNQPTSAIPPIEDFWAVKELSFELKQGEALGIVGRNGAGKSTLLKLLSRITEPTTGRIEIKGRVSSLLEVGTGFHPELTGRENIYLNGAILGMSRNEIARRFDEIVAFAEVEKFLDTPVKRYSSGMYVRLAFAVAAHLEPDILILDEVLAVGDFQFQKKCLGKMGEVVKETGRTIIFVTHDLGAFQALCTRGIYLDYGKLIADGPTGEIINVYRQNMADSSQALSRRKGNGKAQYETFYLSTEDGTPCQDFFMGDTIVVHSTVVFKQKLNYPVFGVDIKNPLGELLLNLDCTLLEVGEGRVNITVKIKDVFLAPSRYFLNFWIGEDQYVTCDLLEGALSFSLIQGDRIKRMLPYPSVAKTFIQSDWSFSEGLLPPSSI